MKKEFTPRTVYYTDELSDEFSSAVITPRKIDGTYKYRRDKNILGKLTSFFLYRALAMPTAYIYLKLKFRHKIVGREKLRGIGGAFIYGNHTQAVADALIPTFISRPRSAYVIVHPNNVSMPVLGRLTPYMGALPLPDDLRAAHNFNKTVRERIAEEKRVFIYPEAHIWPYFTGIRRFKSDSFSYPVKLGVPVFCFTNTYQKRGKKSKVKMITYIDGPFYPDESLNGFECQEELRGRVFECMKARSELSDFVLVDYKPKGLQND